MGPVWPGSVLERVVPTLYLLGNPFSRERERRTDGAKRASLSLIPGSSPCQLGGLETAEGVAKPHTRGFLLLSCLGPTSLGSPATMELTLAHSSAVHMCHTLMGGWSQSHTHRATMACVHCRCHASAVARVDAEAEEPEGGEWQVPRLREEAEQPVPWGSVESLKDIPAAQRQWREGHEGAAATMSSQSVFPRVSS